MKRVWWVLALGLLAICLYVSGPVLAAIFEIGDRRGPRVYPEGFHERVYELAWEWVEHDDGPPRIAVNAPPRPWFYGF